MGRPILVIDSDEDFVEFVREQLTPYSAELIVREPYNDALSGLASLDAALVLLAVEEPDKIGYALCNKAKKLAPNLPVILVTKTIAAADFEQHRTLAVHADDYLDKRELSGVELVQKVDAFVSLGDGDGMDSFGDISLEVDAEDVPELTLEPELSIPLLVEEPSEDLGGIFGGFDEDEAFDSILGPSTPAPRVASAETPTLHEAVAPAVQHEPDHPLGLGRDQSSHMRPASSQARAPSTTAGARAVSESSLARPGGDSPRQRPATAPPPLTPIAPARTATEPRSRPASAPAPTPLFSRPSELMRAPTELARARTGSEPPRQSDADLRLTQPSLSSDMTELQNQVRQLQHARASLEKKNSELEERLLEADGSQANGAQLAQVNADLTAARERAAAAEQAHAITQQQAATAAEGRDDALRQLVEARAEWDALHRQLQNEVNALREAAQTADGARQHANELQAKTEDAMQRARQAEQQLQASKQEAQKARALADQLADDARNSSERLGELTQTLAAAQTQNRGLFDQLSKSEAALAEAQQSVATVQAERGILDEQLTAARAEAVRWQTVAKNLEQEAASVHHSVAEATAATKLVEQHAETIASLNQALATSRAENDDLRASVTELQQNRAGLQEAFDRLKQQEGALQNQLNAIAETANPWETKAHELETRVQQLTSRAELLAQELQSQKQMSASIEADNAKFQDQVVRANQRVRADEEMLAKARKALAVALTVLDDKRA